MPVPKLSRDALSAYLAADMDHIDEAVYKGRQGSLSVEGIAAILDKYAEWAKLDGVTPHVLRHTFAYSYLEHNANDLVALADILGHTDLNTTRMYTRRRLSDLQDGVEQVRFY